MKTILLTLLLTCTANLYAVDRYAVNTDNEFLLIEELNNEHDAVDKFETMHECETISSHMNEYSKLRNLDTYFYCKTKH